MRTLHRLLTEPKAGSEDRLDIVWAGVKRVITKCFNSVKDCSDRQWTLVMFWLSSASKSEPSNTPFSIYLESSTIDRYTRYWQEFIVFVMHGSEEPNGDYGIEFTMEQTRDMNVLRLLLETSSDMDEIDDWILTVSIHFIRHSAYEKSRSALIYFTGVLGYHLNWKRWRSPGDFTNILAGFQWVMRVLVLEKALPRVLRDTWFDVNEKDPLETFKEWHDKYLVENQAYPYDQIHKLLNYGLKASINITSRSRISWSADDKVLYMDGRPLRMFDWKRFGHYEIDLIEDYYMSYWIQRRECYQSIFILVSAILYHQLTCTNGMMILKIHKLGTTFSKRNRVHLRKCKNEC
jgi:hypothetical protein